MTTPALVTRGLVCGRGKSEVVRDVELAVPAGSRLAIIGPNGAGKSTLLRALCGLDRPLSGEIELRGAPMGSLSDRERARQLAVVSQHESPPADLLVRELVGLGRLPHSSPWQRATPSGGPDFAEEALRRLGLEDLGDRAADQISGGELRRVLLARAIAQEADVLVLDEPTNHLDLRHQHEILGIVRELDVTVIAAIHDLDLAGRYFDQIAVVHEGVLQPPRPPEEVLTPELLRKVFQVRATRIRHPESGEWHLLVEPLPVAVR